MVIQKTLKAFINDFEVPLALLIIDWMVGRVMTTSGKEMKLIFNVENNILKVL